MSILKIRFYKRSSLFCIEKQHWVVFVNFFKNPIDRFSQVKIAWPSLADWTDRLSQNIGIPLPINAV